MPAQTDHGPVLLVGLDAMDGARVGRLLAAGHLPTLAALRAGGLSGRIETRPALWRTTVWPAFRTGMPWYLVPPRVGRRWQPDRMRLEQPPPGRAQPPFWERLARDRRVLVIDVPFAGMPRGPLDGTVLAGWQSFGERVPATYPADLAGELASRFGPSLAPAERPGRQTAAGLLRLSAELLAATEQIGAIAAWLLRRETWDLAVVVLGPPHHGGHYLYDLSQIDTRALDRGTRHALAGALDELYMAADRALGRMLEVLPRRTGVIAFALHGMRRNAGWSERGEGVAALLAGNAAPAAGAIGLAARIKRMAPYGVVRAVTGRLPRAVGDWLAARASQASHDWSRTRFLALPGDVDGYLRLNLAGREARGIVPPSVASALLDELSEALLGLRHLDDGQPVVAQVERTDELVPPDAPVRCHLGDLVLRWGDRAAVDSPGVVTRDGRELRWTPGEPLRSGRSGDHAPDGWFVAHGPGIAQGGAGDALVAPDLVATALSWLGEPVPEWMVGNSILPRHPLPAAATAA